ncbi:MAG: hypothetical protein KJZ98_09720 [Burkholderiaceae bacterium]|jgi:hypothetical protein|nr:hypothetical protein [Burkholderiaceae bacterium]MEB2351273.1 transcriptional coactivator p15/PC4 family protein [Burkholderiaceae bacterium]
MSETGKYECEVLAAMPKSANAEIRVTRSRYHGRAVVDVRVWFVPKQGGAMLPSGRGVQLDERRLDSLVELLLEAQRAVQNR